MSDSTRPSELSFPAAWLDAQVLAASSMAGATTCSVFTSIDTATSAALLTATTAPAPRARVASVFDAFGAFNPFVWRMTRLQSACRSIFDHQHARCREAVVAVCSVRDQYREID